MVPNTALAGAAGREASASASALGPAPPPVPASHLERALLAVVLTIVAVHLLVPASARATALGVAAAAGGAAAVLAWWGGAGDAPATAGGAARGCAGGSGPGTGGTGRGRGHKKQQQQQQQQQRSSGPSRPRSRQQQVGMGASPPSGASIGPAWSTGPSGAGDPCMVTVADGARAAGDAAFRPWRFPHLAARGDGALAAAVALAARLGARHNCLGAGDRAAALLDDFFARYHRALLAKGREALAARTLGVMRDTRQAALEALGELEMIAPAALGGDVHRAVAAVRTETLRCLRLLATAHAPSGDPELRAAVQQVSVP